MVLAPGERTSVGATWVQAATLRVVVTAFDTPLLCPPALAVTVVLLVPLVCPVLALTVSVAAVLAPAARLTETGLRVDALKFVLFVSETPRLKVALEHGAVSLFV